jgi:hypothetical protein
VLFAIASDTRMIFDAIQFKGFSCALDSPPNERDGKQYIHASLEKKFNFHKDVFGDVKDNSDDL